MDNNNCPTDIILSFFIAAKPHYDHVIVTWISNSVQSVSSLCHRFLTSLSSKLDLRHHSNRSEGLIQVQDTSGNYGNLPANNRISPQSQLKDQDFAIFIDVSQTSREFVMRTRAVAKFLRPGALQATPGHSQKLWQPIPNPSQDLILCSFPGTVIAIVES